ncbi:Aldehyde dehydrogenase, thermostable [Pseudomonas fluorescens]|uniref:Aldehyde dehydrogenase, thermostable n=2 Tax=Pseudomonas fluorescens TaxID=294 RepID=A0A5E7CFC3_PSEFL|nr:Aldehyde dehydrogenase, thermostable [Pseudomonas fluorescens]
MTQEFKNLIDGQWVAGDGYSENINPANTGEVVGRFAKASSEQVAEAVAAARRTSKKWAAVNSQERTDILRRAAHALRTESARLGEVLSREQGRTLREAIGEVIRSAQVFEYFAGEVVRTGGEIFPSTRSGADVYVTREPVGVVGMITPWNVPSAIPAWKIAPALAYGNCVVIKPADLVPASTWEICRILKESGLPDGVLNLVMGPGRQVGEALLNASDIDAITFTGSVPTGRHVASSTAQRQKKVQCEMGGKNPLIILDDADLELAVEIAIDGGFYWTGQRCTASSRLIVQEGIHDRFVARMLEVMGTLKVDNGLFSDTHIGPAVDERQLNQNLRYVDIARDEGGEVYGGERLTRDTPGFFMSPALILNTENHWRINREEVFGPVCSVIRVKDYEQALNIANDTEFGLSAGICTNSLAHSTHFRKHSTTGVVAVNMTTSGSEYHVAFGGRKASSYGAREQGRYALDFYTAIKTSYVKS